MQYLEVTRDQPNTYVLTGDQHTGLAGMTIYGNVACAEIRTADGTASAARHGWGTILAEDHGRQVAQLARRQTRLPDDTTEARWTIRRRWRSYEGILVSRGRTMTLRLTPFSGRNVQVEVTGQWIRANVVILIASFALLARRRRDQIIMVTAGH